MRCALSGWCTVYLTDSDSQLRGRHVGHLRDVAEAVPVPLVPAHNPRAESQLHHHTHFSSMEKPPGKPSKGYKASILMLHLSMSPPASMRQAVHMALVQNVHACRTPILVCPHA